MSDTPEPASLLRIEWTSASKEATFYMPEDLSMLSGEQVKAFLDTVATARAEWEAKGYTIQFRPYLNPRPQK